MIPLYFLCSRSVIYIVPTLLLWRILPILACIVLAVLRYSKKGKIAIKYILSIWIILLLTFFVINIYEAYKYEEGYNFKTIYNEEEIALNLSGISAGCGVTDRIQVEPFSTASKMIGSSLHSTLNDE